MLPHKVSSQGLSEDADEFELLLSSRIADEGIKEEE